MHRFLVAGVATLVALALSAPANAWTWPADGDVLRPFGLGSDPYAGGQHRGVDVAGVEGVPIRAPAAGTVTFAGVVPTHGRGVTIQTADGYAVTLLHLGAIGVVKGATVTEGAPIGSMGWSGTAEHAAPSVHLGIRRGDDADAYLDPLGLLPPRAGQGPSAAPESTPAPVPTPAQPTEPSSAPAPDAPPTPSAAAAATGSPASAASTPAATAQPADGAATPVPAAAPDTASTAETSADLAPGVRVSAARVTSRSPGVTIAAARTPSAAPLTGPSAAARRRGLARNPGTGSTASDAPAAPSESLPLRKGSAPSEPHVRSSLDHGASTGGAGPSSLAVPARHDVRAPTPERANHGPPTETHRGGAPPRGPLLATFLLGCIVALSVGRRLANEKEQPERAKRRAARSEALADAGIPSG